MNIVILLKGAEHNNRSIRPVIYFFTISLSQIVPAAGLNSNLWPWGDEESVLPLSYRRWWGAVWPDWAKFGYFGYFSLEHGQQFKTWNHFVVVGWRCFKLSIFSYFGKKFWPNLQKLGEFLFNLLVTLVRWYIVCLVLEICGKFLKK